MRAPAAVLGLVLLPAGGPAAEPEPRTVLDLPDDQELREGEPGSLRHRIARVTAVSTATLADFRAADPRAILAAERRGRWLYWAVDGARDVPLASAGGAGSAWMPVVERFRAPLDPP